MHFQFEPATAAVSLLHYIAITATFGGCKLVAFTALQYNCPWVINKMLFLCCVTFGSQIANRVHSTVESMEAEQ